MDDIIEQLSRIEDMLAESANRPPREYLNINEAAEYLNVSRPTLDKWRMDACGPAVHRVGRRVLYSIADLRAFMDDHRSEALA